MSLRRHDIAVRIDAEMALNRADLAARLRELRETHDPPMTQENAAAFIGVPARTYVRWENAEVDASLRKREQIAAAYGIDAQELIAVDGATTIRLTADDFHRLENKIDTVLAILEALAGAPERKLEDAVRAIGSALAAEAPPTAEPNPAARDTRKPAQASGRRRPARAAGKR